METKPVRFIPHGLSSPEVQQRIADGPKAALDRMERINQRLRPYIHDLNEAMRVLQSSRQPLDQSIPTLWKLIDNVSSFNHSDVACRAGCSHCCYVPALVPHAEAAVIGKRIGRTPANARLRTSAKGLPWGYDNPCPFLVNDQCSIYENRPTVCRAHFSLDVDALMCELTPPESKEVPFMNEMPFQMALLQLIYNTTKKQPKVGELREFFKRDND